VREIRLTGDQVEDKSLVLSEMFFPGDPDNRFATYAQCYAQETLKLPIESAVVPCAVLRQLLLHSDKIKLEKNQEEAIKKGIVAGDILMSLYLMDVMNIEEPSLNKAMYVAKCFAQEVVKYRNGAPMYLSQGQIKKIWREYKLVSHLWAAFRVNKAYPFVEEGTEFSEGLMNLVGVAGSIREWAVSFVSQLRQKRTIFSAEDFISICSTPPLQSFRLKPITPPDRLLAYLESYRAEKTGA
jgi:hypothetical protein